MSLPLFGITQHLSDDIGPRGSTTDNERKASDFIHERLTEFGLQPQRQPFLSATSAYAPFALAAGVTLIALFLFWQPQPVGAAAAALLGTGVAIATLFELNLRSNPLRWVIPTGHSQNVWVEISARNTAWRPPILITAHVDTNRAAWLFRTPGWRRVFQLLIPLGLICILVLVVLFVLGVPSDARNLREVALIPGAFILVTFLLLLQGANAPFTRGANDNASGVAVALQLAEALGREPLRTRDVIVAFTGCEEVGGYGADAFISAHRDGLYDAIHVVIDHVGGLAGGDLGPSLIRSERFLTPHKSDPGLVKTAEEVAHQRPDLRARVQGFGGAYSELSIGARHALRTIGVFALDDDGSLPNWHVPGDVAANISAVTLERSFEFAHLFLRALDEDGTA